MKRINDTLYDVLDVHTSLPLTYKKALIWPDGSTNMAVSTANDAKAAVLYPVYRKLGTEYFELSLKDRALDIRLFGAKGNAHNIDKNTGSATFGKAFVDSSLTTPANDDTAAFKKAIDTIFRLTTPTILRGQVNFGYRGQKLRLKIPAGSYYLTEPNVFAGRTEQALQGSQSGFIIEGDGAGNTYLMYHQNSEAEEFLFSDVNLASEMNFRDFGIEGTTGKENLFRQSSSGVTQNWAFNNIAANNYKRFIRVEGVANADKMLFTKVKAVSAATDNCFFEIQNNSQSIAHTFLNCNLIASGNGTLFKLNTGGSISVLGGSIAAENTGTIYKIDSLAGSQTYSMAPTNVSISTYTTKIEVHNDARWVDMNNSHIFMHGEKTRFINNTNNTHKIIVKGTGKLFLDKVTFQDNIKIALESYAASSYSKHKAEVHFLNCTFPVNVNLSTWVDYYENFSTGTLFNSVNKSSIGRVFIRNSNSEGTSVSNMVDGSPYATAGYSSTTNEKKVVFARESANTDYGLPPATGGGVCKVILPLNCTVCRVGIKKIGFAQSGAQAVQRWHVKDGNGLILCTLTTQATTDELCAFSDELWYPITTEALRSVELVADPGNSAHRAMGFMVVEYV